MGVLTWGGLASLTGSPGEVGSSATAARTLASILHVSQRDGAAEGQGERTHGTGTPPSTSVLC